MRYVESSDKMSIDDGGIKKTNTKCSKSKETCISKSSSAVKPKDYKRLQAELTGFQNQVNTLTAEKTALAEQLKATSSKFDQKSSPLPENIDGAVEYFSKKIEAIMKDAKDFSFAQDKCLDVDAGDSFIELFEKMVSSWLWDIRESRKIMRRYGWLGLGSH